jgi:hypothetical protein
MSHAMNDARKTENGPVMALALESWLGVRVICPSAPKYARRGYRGTGWIGRVCEDLGDKVNVTYSNGARRVWHKSHLSRLSA